MGLSSCIILREVLQEYVLLSKVHSLTGVRRRCGDAAAHLTLHRLYNNCHNNLNIQDKKIGYATVHQTQEHVTAQVTISTAKYK